MGSLVWRLFEDGLEDGVVEEEGEDELNFRHPSEEGPEGSFPTELNTKNTGSFLEISRDKRTVRYTGQGSHDNDVGSVQANFGVPSNLSVYYYETKILDGGAKCCVGIGFADKKFKVTRQPGWEPNSYGYHGDDGKKFHSNGLGESYGPTFTTGDVIGAGILMEKQEIFYTKNGEYLGVAFRNVSLPLYPTVGLHSLNERVQVDFVGDQGFMFDPSSLVTEVEENKKQAVEKLDVTTATTHQIVRNYLMHYGYAGTLTAFEEVSGSQSLSKSAAITENNLKSTKRTKLSYAEKLRASTRCGQGDDLKEQALPMKSSLTLRSKVRAHILGGRPEDAEALLVSDLPELFSEKNRSIGTLVRATLACRIFVKLVQEEKLAEAIKFAQERLVEFKDATRDFGEKIQDVLALLAYQRLDKSPVAYLLTPKHADSVADVINRAILYLLGEHTISELEVDLRQLLLVQWQIREVHGSQGQVYGLEESLKGL